MMSQDGNCYVVVRGQADSYQTYTDFLYKNKRDLVLYPETRLTMIDTITYMPYNKAIVTENPYLISSYSRHQVFILGKGGKWVNPHFETFGCSVETITNNILGYGSSIPALPQMKIKELVGEVPKGMKTYGDWAEEIKKEIIEFRYED